MLSQTTARLSAVLIFATGAISLGGTITFSPTAPAYGSFGQAQETNTQTGNNVDSSASSIEPNKPYLGQTFLVPAAVGAGGATLASFSLHVTDYTDSSNSRPFQVQLVEISGADSTNGTPNLPETYGYPYSGPTFTTLATDTATAAPQGNFVDTWLTFNLDPSAQPVLAAGSTYGFAIRATDTGSGLFGDLGYSEDSSYTDGRAFTVDLPGGSGSSAYGRGFDREFVANITAVPEPAFVGVIATAAIGALRRRKRDSNA